MDTPMSNLFDALKALDEKQMKMAKGIVSQVEKLAIHHINLIQDLIYRCSALEAIQLRLFSALAETNPSIHKQIVEELKEPLNYIEKEGGSDTSYAKHVRELLGSKIGKKVHLRLVPKQSSPETEKPPSL